jgi:hypothetical protein
MPGAGDARGPEHGSTTLGARGASVADRRRRPAKEQTRIQDASTEFRHSKASALARTDRVRFWVVALLWAVVNFAFWKWWLRQAPHSSPWLYWAETLALFYQTTLLPTIFWRFVSRMKRPIEVEPVSGMRVALITPCVPAAESLDVIRHQLDALQRVTYPHDSWILDEGGSADVRVLAEARGVYLTADLLVSRPATRTGVGRVQTRDKRPPRGTQLLERSEPPDGILRLGGAAWPDRPSAAARVDPEHKPRRARELRRQAAQHSMAGCGSAVSAWGAGARRRDECGRNQRRDRRWDAPSHHRPPRLRRD